MAPVSVANLEDIDVDGQALSSMVPADSPIAAYLRWALSAHGSPPAFHLASILAVGVHELARRGFKLRIGRKPMATWFTLVGDSASGKSTAIGMAEDFIHDAWAEAQTTLLQDPWVEVEGSIAGLLYSLTDHYESSRGTTVCLAYHHEISAIFNTRESISEMLCRLADGSSYQRHVRELQKKKKGIERDRIVCPQISALFATTEAALAPHFDEAKRAGGIFSRMWWIRPLLSKDHLRFETEASDELEALRADAIDEWVAWFAKTGIHKDRTIRLSPDAQRMLKHGLWEQLRDRFRTDDESNAVRLRVVDKVRVIGALWAMSRNSTVIEVQDLEPAVAFAELLLVHNGRMRTLGLPHVVRVAERLLVAIQEAGEAGLSRRELYKLRRMDKRTLDLALETLVDAGDVVQTTPAKRRTLVYLSCETEAAAEVLERAAMQTIDITSRMN